MFIETSAKAGYNVKQVLFCLKNSLLLKLWLNGSVSCVITIRSVARNFWQQAEAVETVELKKLHVVRVNCTKNSDGPFWQKEMLTLNTISANTGKYKDSR